jgi:hypothetical protein
MTKVRQKKNDKQKIAKGKAVESCPKIKDEDKLADKPVNTIKINCSHSIHTIKTDSNPIELVPDLSPDFRTLFAPKWQ